MTTASFIRNLETIPSAAVVNYGASNAREQKYLYMLQEAVGEYQKLKIEIDTYKAKALLYDQNLDNYTEAEQNAPEEGTSMAKDKRPRVLMGYDLEGKPMYTRISGKNQDERNDNIVRAFIQSGRIWEFMQAPTYQQQPTPTEPPKELHPFTPYATDFYKRFKGKNRGTTHSTQQGWLEQACEFFGDEPIEKINDSRIQDYINSIQVSKTTGEPCTTNGIKQRITFVGEIFNRAIKDKLIGENPCKDDSLKFGGVKGKGIEALSKADILMLMEKIAAAKDLCIKFWLALMLYAGLRREEMLALRWEHINFTEGTISIEQAITYASSTADLGNTKNDSSVRTFYMPDILIETLQPYKQPTGYLVADEQGNPFNDYGIKKLRKAVREHTGLPKLDARQLRHSYATMLSEAGIDIRTVGTTMGHTKTSTTEGYINKPKMDRLKSIRNAGVAHVLS